MYEQLENKVFCCDNIHLLNDLPENYVDLIYCDILYGTGRNFGDFQDLQPIREMIDLHYEVRIKQMKRVLSNSGTIYLQMDYRISHWGRCLMDDIFGYDNLRNEIVSHYNSAPRRKLDLGDRHDTILRYSKTKTYKFNPVREPYSLSAPRGYEKEKYYNENGKVIGDVWNINILGQNDKTERVGFPTQKPLELIKRIISLSSNEGDIVADFYCGSGTTLVAAKQMNRKYLGCDNSIKAIEQSLNRLEG
jgi:site-specific DNA-methyltransferase (adenine-specific)